jgi:NAD(P)-dependent dehydrogenase (short-subunit alcohol dehydrogenase family)
VGGFNWNPLVDLEPPEWRRIVATNLDSVFNMCHLVVPRMREKRFGRIVNFAAVGAATTLGEPQMAAYSAAKAGVVALSRALALEEARCGITVNVVSPGLLRDESGSKRRRRPTPCSGSACRSGAGRAVDVVRAVLFFASRPRTSSPARWSRWRAEAGSESAAPPGAITRRRRWR